MKRLCILLILFCVVSCFSGDYILIGKKEVGSNLYVNFYQKDEFDMVTPLAYELVDNNGSVLVEKSFIIGTNDKLDDAKDIYASIYNDILYISYPYPENVHVIRGLKASSQLDRDELFNIIKANDSTLKDMQKE